MNFTYRKVGCTTALVFQEGREVAVATFDGKLWECDIRFNADRRLLISGHRPCTAPDLDKLMFQLRLEYSYVMMSNSV